MANVVTLLKIAAERVGIRRDLQHKYVGLTVLRTTIAM